jgi:hypothetical protein
MKYVLLFRGSAEDVAAFAALSPHERREPYAEVGKWFEEHRSRIVDAAQLQPPPTATPVRHAWQGGEPRGRWR